MASYRVLIVEDQREVSRLLRSALETLEYEIQVAEAPNGEEALLEASRSAVNILVSDYRLPGMTGIELMRKVRDLHPDVKVILVTGLTDPKVRKEVASAGADSFFIKPVPIADFLDAVERHLGLVESILPAEPVQPFIQEPVLVISDRLAGLRQELGAKAVLLVDGSGHITARAGDLPDASIEVTLLGALMPIYSAGQRLAGLLAVPAVPGWHLLPGDKVDLVFTPIGAGYALAILGKELASGKLAASMHVITDARPSLEATLESMGPAQIQADQPAASGQPEEPAGQDLGPILKKTSRGKMKPEEVDAFWSEAAARQKATPTKPDMITFEQARQLGIAPEDEKK